MIKTDAEAAEAGISPLAEIRSDMIIARDGALDALGEGIDTEQAATAAVFFSHVIWWLSVLLEERDGVSPELPRG